MFITILSYFLSIKMGLEFLLSFKSYKRIKSGITYQNYTYIGFYICSCIYFYWKILHFYMALASKVFAKKLSF